jgi:DNA replication protein DnaC
MTTAATTPEQVLAILLRTLRLPSFAESYDAVGALAERQGWSFGQYLRQLCELEVNDRAQRRVQRLQKRSELSGDKTLATLDLQRLPSSVAKQLPSLCEGGFLGKAQNILLFGLPGRGKTHVACAIGNELIRRGHSVLFAPTYKIVQLLLAAKRDLTLDRALQKLDCFEAIILDDIGYVQQEREEMEVLFTFLAQRYERRSVLITSNIVFSQWDRIFKDPMTTVAAIDRLVHHSVILEMTGTSYRTDAAKTKKAAKSESEVPA